MPRSRQHRANRSSQKVPRDARSAPRRELPRGSVITDRVGPDAEAVLASLPLEPLQTTLIVGPRGGLTLPRAMRRAMAIDPGGSLIAQLTPEGVLLRPALTFPMNQCDVRQVRAAMSVEEGLERYLKRRSRRFR